MLYTSNPVDKIYASFDENLPAGSYYLSIDGTGMGDPGANPPTGYSDYGCLGYYSIEASSDSPDLPSSVDAANSTGS